ncbi:MULTISPECIES: recombinase family protein [Lacticaseibacillus]|uniref:Sin recombinase n=1 Tax=Lacticaseibacillus camelliae DSM 22697 = JCM 13995 TaxID=1423730 RepID=A0A0R2F7P4_9LACO|nr:MULTISPECIES: recombinase family protein [Lacticaseibacillus]KRN24174.1 Sin recombinase [Lacticaseibacillus camelliae DSM 22697 = JCM 13995]
MAKVGYARVSTTDQNLARQFAAFDQAGVTKVFADKLSGKNLERPQLRAMLDYIHEGDEVAVLSVDRLGRNNAELSQVIGIINSKGAMLNILSLPTFSEIKEPNLRRLIINIFLELNKYQAEEERRKILERQQEGIAEAKKRGAYKGGRILYSADVQNAKNRLAYEQLVKLVGEGVPTKEVARRIGVARSTVYRIIKRDHLKD